MAASPFSATNDGVLIAVHVQPRASRPEVGAIAPAQGDTHVLRVRVTAAPAQGQANAAVCELLAKEWAMPKTRLSVARGATSRHKTIHVAGDSEALLRQLDTWARARSAT
jgi:uncharacterized protein (TIGR00251 family)